MPKRIPRPPKEELERKRLIERQTTVKMASDYNCSVVTVRMWLHQYDISLRRFALPTKEELKNFRKEGLTHADIAHMLHDQGIEAKHTRSGTSVKCQILDAHAKEHADDPNRFRTSFCLEQIEELNKHREPR